jgi:hypothetical protein
MGQNFKCAMSADMIDAVSSKEKNGRTDKETKRRHSSGVMYLASSLPSLFLRWRLFSFVCLTLSSFSFFLRPLPLPLRPSPPRMLRRFPLLLLGRLVVRSDTCPRTITTGASPACASLSSTPVLGEVSGFLRARQRSRCCWMACSRSLASASCGRVLVLLMGQKRPRIEKQSKPNQTKPNQTKPHTNRPPPSHAPHLPRPPHNAPFPTTAALIQNPHKRILHKHKPPHPSIPSIDT